MKFPDSIRTVRGHDVDLMELAPLSANLTGVIAALYIAALVEGHGELFGGWVMGLVWTALSWAVPVALCAIYGGFRPDVSRSNRRRYAR